MTHRQMCWNIAGCFVSAVDLVLKHPVGSVLRLLQYAGYLRSSAPAQSVFTRLTWLSVSNTDNIGAHKAFKGPSYG
jgi:hypothetical protein